MWSSKVVNDEAAILDAIGEVLGRAQQVSWAVDITGTSSALLLALLHAHAYVWQPATYVPGRRGEPDVHRVRGGGQDRRQGRLCHR